MMALRAAGRTKPTDWTHIAGKLSDWRPPSTALRERKRWEGAISSPERSIRGLAMSPSRRSLQYARTVILTLCRRRGVALPPLALGLHGRAGRRQCQWPATRASSLKFSALKRREAPTAPTTAQFGQSVSCWGIQLRLGSRSAMPADAVVASSLRVSRAPAFSKRPG